MDFIKKAASSASGNNAQQSTTGGQNVQQDDYVDKAFSAVTAKSGHNIDRNTQEKITDGGRNAYEKYSGNKVPSKISN